MSPTFTLTSDLNVEDFRRLGVRPNELRLAVIRRAAARTTRTIAQQQLQAPSQHLAIQLGRVATSAYRLLDPRKRPDAYQRAHLGRILPNTLSGVAQTNFLNNQLATIDRRSTADVQSISGNELLDDCMPSFETGAPSGFVRRNLDDIWLTKLVDDDLRDSTPFSRRLGRLRRRLMHPWIWFSISGLMVGTFLGLTTLGPNLKNSTFRLASRDDAQVRSAPISALDLASSTEPDSFPVASVHPVTVANGSIMAAVPTSAAAVESAATNDPVPPIESEPEKGTGASWIASYEVLRKEWLATLETAKSELEARAELETNMRSSQPAPDGHLEQQLAIARTMWIKDSIDEVRDFLLPLSLQYELVINEVLASTFVAALSNPQNASVDSRMMSVGLTLCDLLLMEESFVESDDVASALIVAADVSDDKQTRDAATRFIESSQQMNQLRQSISQVTSVSGDVNKVSLDDVEAGSLGRYHCLLLRRWNPESLSWLTHSSDYRIAGVARQELALGSSSTCDEVAKIAQRWNGAAQRASGRSSESIRLHAIDLMRNAADSATGLKRLEFERTIDRDIQTLPKYLYVSARGEKALTPTKAVDAHSDPAASLPVITTTEMSGRIFVAQNLDDDSIAFKDMGVQIDYELDVPITQSMFNTITTRLGRSISDSTIELRVTGELVIEKDCVAIFSLAPGIDQALLLDGQPMVIDPLESSAQRSLATGRYRIEWTVDVTSLESKVFLGIDDSVTRKRLPVVPCAIPVNPSILTVAVLRSGD